MVDESASPHGAYAGSSLRRALLNRFQTVEALFDRAFTPAHNPWRHLGALAFFFFWIVVVSGIYLYAFSESGVERAYVSVERLTRKQWYLGGVARSLHRYGADAFMVAMVLHLAKEWIAGHYHGFRWFSWVTGVPLIGLALASGVVGFWLVWDRLGQFAALATVEWLDVLPIFSEPLVCNFLMPEDVSDRFFTLAMFLHLGLPLALLLLAWVHLQRISHPVIHPPRPLALGTLTALLLLALLKPVTNHAPADLATIPMELRLDWFYLFPLPAVYAWSPVSVWALGSVVALLLLFLPLLPRPPRAPVAKVSLANYNGCGHCHDDCPYNAVVLRPRSDGLRAPREAVVLPELCAGCGICVGACPSSTPFRSVVPLLSGIDMPQLPIGALRARFETAVVALQGRPKIMVFGCDWGADVERLRSPSTAAFRLLCAGMLPPSFIEYALRGGAEGVLVTGCRERDCAFRLGNRWTAERLQGKREPHLRRNVPPERLHVFWAGPRDLHRLLNELQRFRARLLTLPAPHRAAEGRFDCPGDGALLP